MDPTYRAEGKAGLWDRSSAPHSVPGRTPWIGSQRIATLRRLRMTRPEIAEVLEMAGSTSPRCWVGSVWASSAVWSRRSRPIATNRAKPGDLIHIDVKKLVRIEKGAGHRVTGEHISQAKGAGWERIHDATRLAYVEILSEEKARTAIGFLKRAIAF